MELTKEQKRELGKAERDIGRASNLLTSVIDILEKHEKVLNADAADPTFTKSMVRQLESVQLDIGDVLGYDEDLRSNVLEP